MATWYHGYMVKLLHDCSVSAHLRMGFGAHGVSVLFRLLPTAYCLLPTVNCQPSTAYYFNTGSDSGSFSFTTGALFVASAVCGIPALMPISVG